MVVGVIFMSLSGKPTYSPLFTNLQPSDAAAITQKLATDKVPYQLQDGGTTILVPQNDVDQERLSPRPRPACRPQSTVGLSLLDKEGITTSQLTQQADYLQAIQGELEQTIDSIQGVDELAGQRRDAREPDFALGSTNPTGASVLVDLQPGHTLSNDEVQAISTSSRPASPASTLSDVTVADSQRRTARRAGASTGGASRPAPGGAYDAERPGQGEAYLAGVLGAGNADVQVNATLDYDKVQTDTQSLVPGANGGAPASCCTNTKQTTTKYTGAGTPSGRVAGSSPSRAAGNGNYTQTRPADLRDQRPRTRRPCRRRARVPAVGRRARELEGDPEGTDAGDPRGRRRRRRDPDARVATS